jgi:hypothetical protein
MTFEPPPSVAAALAKLDIDEAAAALDGVPFCRTHRIRHEDGPDGFVCARCVEEEGREPPPQAETLFGVVEDPQTGYLHIRDHDPRDAEAGKREREAAVARVTNAAPSDWLGDAWEALVAICGIKRLTGSTVTTDDVWALLTARQIDPPPERRAMAAVIRRAEREGLIEKTDRFVPSELPWAHRRNTQVWKVL